MFAFELVSHFHFLSVLLSCEWDELSELFKWFISPCDELMYSTDRYRIKKGFERTSAVVSIKKFPTELCCAALVGDT